MKAIPRKHGGDGDYSDRSKGLFRTHLAGVGRSIFEAFENLERSPNLARFVRHPSRKLFGARVKLPPEEGEGYWDLTQIGDEMYVMTENFVYKDPRIELVPGDGLVQLYFKLTGDLTMSVSRAEALRLNRPSLTIYRQPKGVDIDEWVEPSAHERCVAVSVKPEFLINNFFGASTEGFRQLRDFLASTTGEFQYLQLPLSSEMFQLAEKLVKNPHTGILGLVYTESVTTELVCTAIASFDSLNGMAVEHYTRHELKCLARARQHLMTQLAPAPTIRQVARIAGMNETALKRSFKAVYGETVSDFSVRCRMQHALTLLRDQQVSVKRVADACGYRHQTSFATAFGRHFGLRPSDLRKNLRS
ncbi:MAG TPA: AraC family transcriptional regulator [Steroidobacteraceae bacterium]